MRKSALPVLLEKTPALVVLRCAVVVLAASWAIAFRVASGAEEASTSVSRLLGVEDLDD